MSQDLAAILPPVSEQDFYEDNLVGSRKRPGLLTLYGWKHYHTRLSKGSDRGWPDLAAVRDTRLILAELKRDDGVLSKEQREWLEALERVRTVEVYEWRPRDLERIARVLAR
jgi:hypothetical protein